jgi:Fic family protein
MEDFVNSVNWQWEAADAVVLAAYVLWRLNYIHPFINGNGRTARAACYFVLCVKAKTWLPGAPILPELIKRERPTYVAALRDADRRYRLGDPAFFTDLHHLLTRLLQEQLGQFPALPAPAL